MGELGNAALVIDRHRGFVGDGVLDVVDRPKVSRAIDFRCRPRLLRSLVMFSVFREIS